MNVIGIIQAILSSAVLGALITYITQNRALVANNIAKTRIKTDNTRIMKKSLEILYDDKVKNEEKKLEWIPKIKRCLNPYYYHDFNLDSEIPISLNNEDVEHDVLIWYVIKKIEYCDENNKAEDKEKYMKVLPSLIAANIKFDWDRYQSETSSKYKKNYAYDYYKAVKSICKTNEILKNIEFYDYTPKLNVDRLYFYSMAVLFILSYFFSCCCLLGYLFIFLLMILILLCGIAGLINTLAKDYKETSPTIFESAILLSSYSIVLLIVFININKYIIPQCIPFNCINSFCVFIVLIIIILAMKFIKNKK